MGWLLGAFLVVAVPGASLVYWLTGDGYRGVHRVPAYAGRHAAIFDPDGPTLVIRTGATTKFLVTSEHDT